MDLFNNYTWFLTDPVNGDQFHQHDDRVYGGGGASRTVSGSLFGLPTETVYGIQSRYDDIDIALSNTVQRQFLSSILADHVEEGNAGIYAENTVHWTDWLRTTLGWRGDYLCGIGEFDAAVREFGEQSSGDRQPQIQDGVRPVRQYRIIPRRRHGLSQQ